MADYRLTISDPLTMRVQLIEQMQRLQVTPFDKPVQSTVTLYSDGLALVTVLDNLWRLLSGVLIPSPEYVRQIEATHRPTNEPPYIELIVERH